MTRLASDALVLAERNLVRLPRAPDLLIAFTIQPVMFVLLFGSAFSWIFALLGMSVSSPEAANGVGFTLIFPITFISAAFVPVGSMPDGLRQFAEVNPITVVVDAMRALWLGAPAGDSVWGAVAWSLGLIAVFAPLAVAKYRRTASR